MEEQTFSVDTFTKHPAGWITEALTLKQYSFSFIWLYAALPPNLVYQLTEALKVREYTMHYRLNHYHNIP